MKQLLMAVCIFLFSCTSPGDKTKQSVGDYIRKTTIRPESYEPGTWEMVKAAGGTIHVRHKYRAFNGIGAMETIDGFFEVNEAGQVTEISAADF